VKNVRLWIVLPLVALLVAPSFAAAEGWGLPNLNPWAKKPAQKSAFASARKEPSTWQKMSKGTASTWKKTTAALTPWKKSTPPPARPTGVRSPAAKQASKTTWYNPVTWFKDDKGSRAPSTPGEFLTQPRNY
jgi:hypothetical protein